MIFPWSLIKDDYVSGRRHAVNRLQIYGCINKAEAATNDYDDEVVHSKWFTRASRWDFFPLSHIMHMIFLPEQYLCYNHHFNSFFCDDCKLKCVFIKWFTMCKMCARREYIVGINATHLHFSIRQQKKNIMSECLCAR